MGDELSCYEIEATLGNGTQVDAQLDEDVNVVADETENADRDDPADDD